MNIMTEAMLKELLNTKLRAMNGVIQVIPPQMKEPVILSGDTPLPRAASCPKDTPHAALA
ncbi:MAG: hypothetical protein K6U80_13825 [Firmicutes bacterium]|nr:hypothetical protein [Bacillota bacterium]